MKKTAFVFIIIIIITMCCGAASTKAIHPDTPIFEDSDFDSSIVFYIPQNASVIIIEDEFTIDNTSWQKVQYGSYIGYVDASMLYQTENQTNLSVEQIKATSDKMGEKIKIYEANSAESDVITKVNDGTKLKKVINDIDYGNFYEISYNDKRAFIKKDNTTTGLTYNQKIALIIGASTISVLAFMFFIIRSTRKKRIK